MLLRERRRRRRDARSSGLSVARREHEPRRARAETARQLDLEQHDGAALFVGEDAQEGVVRPRGGAAPLLHLHGDFEVAVAKRVDLEDTGHVLEHESDVCEARRQHAKS